ncbi:5,6-dimethylbenzimidazole synthase [Hymenobacter terrenus]|uniref:5,6-dimethylbenzimidazole synthase n=1 Tax=Hymenobacter terrenus TaxID=1629124 RepID=UPI000619F57B|nr:5,6-dimethylbenzimidazole synthase [Hymenobacter terrenus]
MNQHQFSAPEIRGVYRAIYERRDMRHFTPAPVDAEQLHRFMEAAHRAPSVGYMQPWRFIRVVSPELRQRIHAHVNEERVRTAHALGQRAEAFMQLKVEGILTCAEVLVVGLMEQRENHVFGRRTMPHMDLASVSCAIQNFWLATRAEGIGVGWVSLFDPNHLRDLCQMPADSEPVAVLCVGHVESFYPAPMLEIEEWDSRRSLDELFYKDAWGQV